MEMTEYDELAKRVGALEKELAEAKRELEAVKPVVDVPKPEKPWPKYDPTEGMSMPMNAMKPMVDLINPKDVKYDPNAFARNRLSEPGGFGGPPKSRTVSEPEKRGSGWVDPLKLDQPPGIKYIDQQIDVQDAIDKAELKRRLGGK
jgi:hypothetical protein